MSMSIANKKSGAKTKTWKIDWITWRIPFKNDRHIVCKNEHEMWNKKIKGDDDIVIKAKESQWSIISFGHLRNAKEGKMRNWIKGRDIIR